MINLALIGTGARATAYIRSELYEMRRDVRIAALCDINVPKLESFREKYFLGKDCPVLYDNYMDIMENPDIDGVIITTNDLTHKDITLAAFSHGKHVLLEKPIATTLEDAIAIYSARMEHPQLTFRVGFTLRYTPLYSQIKKLLEEKAIGKIVTIEASEALSYMHGASFFRRWHRFRGNNGGFLNAKCSHDMDLLIWLSGEEPLYMSAFGSRSYFIPKQEAAKHCRDCKLRYDCKYAVLKEPESEHDKDLWDACPYLASGDIVDHEVMSIECTNGVTASFTTSLISAEPESNRTMRIHGSEGTIEANLKKGEIILRKTYPALIQTIDVSTAAVGGHSGGDPRLFCSFVDAIRTGENPDTGDARLGMLASVLGIGSLEAMDEHKVIDIPALIEKIQKSL